MRTGKWIGLAAVTSLVGAAIWVAWFSPFRSAPDPASEREMSEPTPASVSDVNAKLEETAGEMPEADSATMRQRAAPPRRLRNSELNSRLSIMRDAESASSAIERANALEQLAESDPALAARKLLELAQFCAPEHLRAEERLGSSAKLLEQRRAWCADLELSVEAIEARLKKLTQIDEQLEGEEAEIERLARHPYVGREYELEERIFSEQENRQTERFTQLVRQARDFDDLSALITINTLHAQDHGGQPLWRLGSELNQRFFPQADLLTAQRSAIMLYGCRRFGGCGPGQYMTMTICTIGIFGQCVFGTTLENQIYLTTAPATYNLALEILSTLLSSSHRP